MKPMNAAPQASAWEAALLAGFHYPAGKLVMSQDFSENQDELSCQQQKGQFRLLQEEEEDRDEPGSPSGTAHPGALWHQHLSSCPVNCAVKKKQSEGKQCSSSHTNSQLLSDF